MLGGIRFFCVSMRRVDAHASMGRYLTVLKPHLWQPRVYDGSLSPVTDAGDQGEIHLRCTRITQEVFYFSAGLRDVVQHLFSVFNTWGFQDCGLPVFKVIFFSLNIIVIIPLQRKLCPEGNYVRQIILQLQSVPLSALRLHPELNLCC